MALFTYLYQITYFSFIDLDQNNLQMILKDNLPYKGKIIILGRITSLLSTTTESKCPLIPSFYLSLLCILCKKIWFAPSFNLKHRGKETKPNPFSCLLATDEEL